MRDKKDLNEWDQEDIKKREVKDKLVNAEQSKAKILIPTPITKERQKFNNILPFYSLIVVLYQNF